MAEDGDQNIAVGLNLAGFLFGNINERGELEDGDLLDQVERLYFMAAG